jgi:NADH-quinone oxidoreductase subunit I
MIVARPKLSFFEKLYFPALLTGLRITFGHWFRTFRGLLFPRKNSESDESRSLMELSATGQVTMQYPEEKWTYPDGYRGAPALVKDEDGREKCVSCQLCEFVCPPRAIRIVPGTIPAGSPNEHVEKAPREFDIDMIRCIYCGLCEEVCPEEAIYLKKEYPVLVSYGRESMVHDKEKLYEMGGVVPRPIKKWADK